MLPYLPSGVLVPGLVTQWVSAQAPPGWTANGNPKPGDYQFKSPDGLLVTLESVAGSTSLVDRVLDYVAVSHESHGRYDNVVPNDNGAGLSYGLLSFNQRVGELPAVFVAMQRANPAKFAQYLGEDASKFLNEQWVRAANLKPYITTLKAMAQEPEFQRAQRQVGKTAFYDRAEQRARRYGLLTERGLTALVDAGVQRGFGNVDKALASTVRAGATPKEILTQFAIEIDKNRYAAGRRVDIVRDRSLSDGSVGDKTEWVLLRLRRKGGLRQQDVEVARGALASRGQVLSIFPTSATDADVWVKLV